MLEEGAAFGCGLSGVICCWGLLVGTMVGFMVDTRFTSDSVQHIPIVCTIALTRLGFKFIGSLRS